MAGKADRAIAQPAPGYLPEPEGAEAMPVKAGVSGHTDPLGLGSLPSRPDLGIAQPHIGRYGEVPEASLVFDAGAVKNTALSRFLTTSHYRDASTAPIPSREVHDHLHLALRAILNQLVSIKKLDDSSM